MSRSGVLILLGVLTILAPFSGLPSPMRTLLAVIFGATVAGMGVAMRSRQARTETPRIVATPEVAVMPKLSSASREISPV